MARLKATLRIGHSPDPDDAFMFYALACGRIPLGGIQFHHVVEDIERLNQRALRAELEVTALSAFAFFEVADRYALMPCGASIGENYGPILVSKNPLYPKELAGKKIAVPGLHTTAYLLLRMFQPDFEAVVRPFDQILEAVREGSLEAGLVIHEGQLTYRGIGLHKVADLGEWFYQTTKLPLPLGVDAIHKNLGRDVMRKATRLLRDSIQYGLKHRAQALEYAMKFGRGISPDTADAFVGMYVNDYTVDMGRKAREGLRLLQKAALERGILKHRHPMEGVDL